MTDAIIVVNAGSTSLKFGADAMNAVGSLPLLCSGQLDDMQGAPPFAVADAQGASLATHEWGAGEAFCEDVAAGGGLGGGDFFDRGD